MCKTGLEAPLRIGARFWLAAMFSCAAAAQPGPFAGAAIDFHADRVKRNGNMVTGSGHVRASIGPLLVESDQGTLNRETGALEARGHVRTTLPARSDRNLIRCGPRAIVTEEAVALSAERITVKDGLLRARGKVEVTTSEGVLRADEIDVYLNLGDAEARGNVRLNGTPTELPRPRGLLERQVFPPEIIR
jgi:lipopolysaccharide assembly outer membrane protein LptD (OstA)